MIVSEALEPRIVWEHRWDDARSRARNERKLLLIDVEKDN